MCSFVELEVVACKTKEPKYPACLDVLVPLSRTIIAVLRQHARYTYMSILYTWYITRLRDVHCLYSPPELAAQTTRNVIKVDIFHVPQSCRYGVPPWRSAPCRAL